MNRHIWIGLLLVVVNSAMGAEPSAVALPPGVKAVWDLDKAYHETTPTRQRICINGLAVAAGRGESGADAHGGLGLFQGPGALARHRRLPAERQPDALHASKLRDAG
jgi:hypothetical protein